LEFCLFLVGFFGQVWLQCLGKISDLLSSHCLLSLPSHQLGSSPNKNFKNEKKNGLPVPKS
jgi:hypothetical protein